MKTQLLHSLYTIKRSNAFQYCTVTATSCTPRIKLSGHWRLFNMAGTLLLLYWHRRIISSMGCVHLGWTELQCYLFPEEARTHVAKCCVGSYLLEHKVPLHNQSVRVPVTRTWLLELGPDCLRRSHFDAQMPEGPKGYSWNAPKILQF